MTTIKLDTKTMTEEQRAAFIEGWEEACGYIDDMGSPDPWCAPWYTQEIIEVTGNDPKEWGAQYWEQCKDEIEHYLVVEEEL